MTKLLYLRIDIDYLVQKIMKNQAVKQLALTMLALLGIALGAAAQSCYYVITNMTSKHHEKSDGNAGFWISVDYKAQDEADHVILMVLFITDQNGNLMKSNTSNSRFHDSHGTFAMSNGISVGPNLAVGHEDFFIPYYVFPDFTGRRDYRLHCDFYDKTLNCYIERTEGTVDNLDFHITRSGPQQPARLQAPAQPQKPSQPQPLPPSADAAQSYNPLGLQMEFDPNRNPFHLNYEFQPPAGAGSKSSQSSPSYLLRAGDYEGYSCLITNGGEIERLFKAFMKVNQNFVTISLLDQNSEPAYRIPINLDKAHKSTAPPILGGVDGVGYFADSAEIGSPSFRGIACFKYNGQLYIFVDTGGKQYLFQMLI